MSTGLLGCGFHGRNYRHESATIGFCTKLDMAFDLGEQSMVGAHADIKAGMPGGAALAPDLLVGALHAIFLPKVLRGLCGKGGFAVAALGSPDGLCRFRGLS